MFKKILVGLAAVALACMLATAGYRFGHALATSHDKTAVEAPAAD